MSINDQLDSILIKRSEGSVILPAGEDDDFVYKPVSKRKDDLEMDITPMIDITFLLLIFFLVSSHPDQTTSIQLPPAHHGGAISQKTSVVLSVAAGGIDSAPVYRGDGKVAANELSRDPETRAQEITKFIEDGVAEGKTEVVVKGDRGIACRDIAGVMRAVSKIENVKINLAVMESHSN